MKIIAFLLLNFSLLFAQNQLFREDFLNKLSDLKSEFGKDKKIPKEFELEALVALSYYPELKNHKINFKYKKLKVSMDAQPNFSFVLKSNKNWSFIIHINKDSSIIKFKEFNFNQLVGLIGHELCHLSTFLTQSKSNLILSGLKYVVNPKFVIQMEKNTDYCTIDHGLGFQLADFTRNLLTKATISESYRERKKKNYLSPEEIEQKATNK